MAAKRKEVTVIDGDGVVQEAKAGAPPAQVSNNEGTALLAMIERAARDPNVDIDKMERLFGMHERMQAQRAKAEYLAAFAEMQKALPKITKEGVVFESEKDDSRNKTQSQPQKKVRWKYAKWEDVCDAIMPVLGQFGFSLSFRTEQPTPDRIVVTAVLGHRAGHSEQTSFGLGIDSTGGKNNPQGWGSSVSYGKRYTAFAMLNLAAADEDDDGDAAGRGAMLTDEQENQLRTALDEADADIPAFCAFFKIDKFADLPAARLKEALNMIELKKKKAAKKEAAQ